MSYTIQMYSVLVKPILTAHPHSQITLVEMIIHVLRLKSVISMMLSTCVV